MTRLFGEPGQIPVHRIVDNVFVGRREEGHEDVDEDQDRRNVCRRN